jgi:hypothetical protein
MPHTGHQFRPPPRQSRVAPLTTSVIPQPPSSTGLADDGFGEEEEVGRIEPKPRARMSVAAAAASSAAAGGGAQVASSPPGSSFKNPFLGRLAVQEWDINPYRVAKDLLGQQ